MPSSEKIVSPGVFTNEVDQTFLPAAIGDIGAAIVGPTVKGPAMIPTVVNSYSEFQAIFGDKFVSGAGGGATTLTYLTSTTAREYLKHQSPLTVVRILDGAFEPAVANVTTGSGTFYTGSAPIGHVDSTLSAISFKLHTLHNGSIFNNRIKGANPISGSTEVASGSVAESAVAKIALENDETIDYVGSGDVISLITTDGKTITCTLGGSGDSTTNSATDGNVQAKTFAGGTSNDTQGTAQAVEIATAINYNNYFTATNSGSLVEIVQAVPGAAGNTTVTITELGMSGMNLSHSFQNGREPAVKTNGILDSGSKDNIRWEVTSVNRKKGTFNLLIRRGDDTNKQKQILETWNNLSLDVKADNYISKVIGDQKIVMSGDSTDPYLATSGSYINKSKYIRVEPVQTISDYLDENGNVRVMANADSGSFLPGLGSGSLGGTFMSGSDGFIGFDMFGNQQGDTGTPTFYENIGSNTQGYTPDDLTTSDGGYAYAQALNLLKNQDEYDFNLLLLPGILANGHSAIFQKAIDVCEDRGDALTVLDVEPYSTTNIATVTAKAKSYNSNYAATYWPWVKMFEPSIGRDVWTPPSVGVTGVLAFNDKVSHEWFAPAGLNRGTINTARMTARKVTHKNRDELYKSNVNPIATFPGQGVAIWGQKTLQKKASALDRINVRRLMIRLKKFIASSSRFLVFEQNTSKTRQRFLNIVNPFMEQVQANSGLSAFRVVMDESNNTPDVIDRNILYGQIFVQPTRTAEFIVLDFTLQPTGATFDNI